MSAPPPTIVTGTLAGPNGTATTIATGAFKRLLFFNFDPTNPIGFTINGSAEGSLQPLTNYGDTYPSGIERVVFINRGGAPLFQVILHP